MFKWFSSYPWSAYGTRTPPVQDETHLKAAIDWLLKAQDTGSEPGISYGYYFRGKGMNPFNQGWRQEYVETSGYCVETLFDLATEFQNKSYHTRAIRLADWLLAQQNSDGSYANAYITSRRGLVFDTGQVLIGLRRAFLETRHARFQLAAKRAAIWLLDAQDEDGVWRRDTHLGRVHTYNARTAWALQACQKMLPDMSHRIESAVIQNLTWVQSRQLDTGFFQDCGFRDNKAPFIHTIAYTIRGLLESGISLQRDDFIKSARQASDALLPLVDENGFLAGKVSLSGEARARSACLTGHSQLALIYFILNRVESRKEYIKSANRLLEYVMSTQKLMAKHEGVHGGIAGSYPVWGTYTPLAYPNWATKFFIDAMLERERHKGGTGRA